MRIAAALFVACAVGLAPSCGPAPALDAPGLAPVEVVGDAGPSGTDAGSPTWSGVYRDILANTCTASNCHTPARGFYLDLSTAAAGYQSMVNVAGTEPCAPVLVMPGSPAQSTLIVKVSGASCMGTQMPLDGLALSPAQVERLSDWIALGAAND